MLLVDHQRDSLTELINIAFARAGASLSSLTEQHVTLFVPDVTIYPVAEIIPSLSKLLQNDVAAIQQDFHGPVAGEALFVLSRDSAATLVRLLDPEAKAAASDVQTEETLVEVGNIVLGACLGVFGNLLKVHFSFAVPHLQLQSLNVLLSTVLSEHQELQYALVILTAFQIQRSALQGYMIIVLGLVSMQRLLQSVDELG